MYRCGVKPRNLWRGWWVRLRNFSQKSCPLFRANLVGDLPRNNLVRGLRRGAGFTLIFALGLSMIFNSVYGQQESKRLPKLIIFHSPGCHKCVQVKNTVIPVIEKQYKDLISIEYRDIDDMENYKLLLGLRDRYGPKVALTVPVFFFEGKLLNGKGDVAKNLKMLIGSSLMGSRQDTGRFTVDLIKYFKNFTPLAVIGAGLIDGINPCAFTVIVFFISFLALQGYKKKELIIIGICFISAVFLTYLLLGLGIFNFLYRLKGFWLVTRFVNISIGVFSIVLGIFALYDFLKYKKTKQTDGLLLQLPQSVKNRIHYVIGLHYRKTESTHPEQTIIKKHIFKLTAAALVTGFLVSLLEAVCTGQTYLPTISFILKTTSLQLQALSYLLVYNFMFIVPLLIIFVFALLGVTSEQFANFLKKHLLAIKILMAIIFFGFGIFLIWKS
jgi:cytochrome c biogenesis protein CcdA